MILYLVRCLIIIYLFVECLQCPVPFPVNVAPSGVSATISPVSEAAGAGQTTNGVFASSAFTALAAAICKQDISDLDQSMLR